jgi:RimJ/RimL family protein N-acetyltransferase
MMIRELRDNDAEALADSPLAFGASPTDDFVSSSEAVREQLRRAPDWAILGAFEHSLVGAVGLFRDRHLKSSHKVHLWGMYVVPSHRRRGIATELLQAALHQARVLPGVSWVHLSVSSAAPGARRLYERAGFHVWGTEPEALRYDGQAVVEYHMALHLEEAPPNRRGAAGAAKGPRG